MRKKTRVAGSYNVTITIPEHDGGAPDLDSLPEWIEIPKHCTANIMFEFDEGVDAGWKFEHFSVIPIGDVDDFSIDEHPGTLVGGNKEFALNVRTFNVKDENADRAYFKYKLSANDGTNRVEVDPGIGNGGQN